MLDKGNTPSQMVWNVADELSTPAAVCNKSRGSDTVNLPICLLGEAQAELKARREGAFFTLVRISLRILAIMEFGLELVKIVLRGERVRFVRPFPRRSVASGEPPFYCDKETLDPLKRRRILKPTSRSTLQTSSSRRWIYHTGRRDVSVSVGAGCSVEEAVADGHRACS